MDIHVGMTGEQKQEWDANTLCIPYNNMYHTVPRPSLQSCTMHAGRGGVIYSRGQYKVNWEVR